jgi:hypothetical protein
MIASELAWPRRNPVGAYPQHGDYTAILITSEVENPNGKASNKRDLTPRFNAQNLHCPE